MGVGVGETLVFVFASTTAEGPKSKLLISFERVGIVKVNNEMTARTANVFFIF